MDGGTSIPSVCVCVYGGGEAICVQEDAVGTKKGLVLFL